MRMDDIRHGCACTACTISAKIQDTHTSCFLPSCIVHPPCAVHGARREHSCRAVCAAHPAVLLTACHVRVPWVPTPEHKVLLNKRRHAQHQADPITILKRHCRTDRTQRASEHIAGTQPQAHAPGARGQPNRPWRETCCCVHATCFASGALAVSSGANAARTLHQLPSACTTH